MPPIDYWTAQKRVRGLAASGWDVATIAALLDLPECEVKLHHAFDRLGWPVKSVAVVPHRSR